MHIVIVASILSVVIDTLLIIQYFFPSHFRLALPATSTISISLKSSNASNQLELATLLRITSENFRSIHLVVQVSWYGEIGVTCLVNCRSLAAVARYRSAEMYHILIAHFMMSFFPFSFVSPISLMWSVLGISQTRIVSSRHECGCCKGKKKKTFVVYFYVMICF